MSARNWCFTYHHEQLATKEFTRQLVDSVPGLLQPNGLGYVIFQRERAPETGAYHLQGYAQFTTRKSLKQSKAALNMLFPNCHLEKAKGSAKQNKEYCSKEESRVDGPWEFGEMICAGKRNDIDEFVEAMSKESLSFDDIYDRYPSILAKYPNFVRSAIRRRRKLEPIPYEPRGTWQLDLVAYCFSPSHPRQVRWYYDNAGGMGKSYFCRHFGHGIGYIITGGKHADIYYAYDHQPYVFFDWPRSAEDTFPYGVAEAFKNGYFLSTKYESVPVKFQPPIVIIFANFPPDETKLSRDRWDIIHL